MGDINVDILQEGDNDNTKIEELLTSFDLTRLKLPPTRITHHTKTSIDWICTNIDHQLIASIIILSGLSDHTAQIATLQLKGSRLPSNNRKKKKF